MKQGVCVCIYTCKPRVLSFFIATRIGSAPSSGSGLIVPLYTFPKPPSPILSILLKPCVAFTISCKVKILKLCSFSLYNSFMLLGDGSELGEDLLAPLLPTWFLFFLRFGNSGSDFDLFLKKKQFIFIIIKLQNFLSRAEHRKVWDFSEITMEINEEVMNEAEKMKNANFNEGLFREVKEIERWEEQDFKRKKVAWEPASIRRING